MQFVCNLSSAVKLATAVLLMEVLRSVTCHAIDDQVATRISFKPKAFSITAPAVWNSLSPVAKSSATITTFKAHLKTELFAASLHTTLSTISS